MRVTADTNVLVSALNFPGSRPYQLLELARSGAIDLAISGHLLDELEDVLRRKFKWPDADIREMRRQFRMFAQYVIDPDAVDVITADPDDNRILEAATGLHRQRGSSPAGPRSFPEHSGRQGCRVYRDVRAAARRTRIVVSSTGLLDGADLSARIGESLQRT